MLVGEHVDYPGGGPRYNPPDPPFTNWSLSDPTVLHSSGATGGGQDNHRNFAMVAGPAASFTGTQNYRFHDKRTQGVGGNPNNLNWGFVFLGFANVPLERFVENVGGWRYRITKMGLQATRPVP